jgi:predicted CopG family antitoxin
MAISTIQISENAKRALTRIKQSKETYEEVILSLLKFVEKSKRGQEQLLIEGCKEMAGENLRITKDFEAIEDLGNWAW